MAVLPNGRRIKADGHTRAELWERGELARPEELLVDVWECDTIEDVKELYTRFDNQLASETAPDKASGSLREIGLAPTSRLLKKNSFTSAIRYSYELIVGRFEEEDRFNEIYIASRAFREELNILDQIDFSPSLAYRGVIIAIITTARVDGIGCMEFWRKVSENQGMKSQNMQDAVQALLTYLQGIKGAKNTSSSSVIMDMFEVCISGYDAYKKNHMFNATGKKNILHRIPKLAQAYLDEATENESENESDRAYDERPWLTEWLKSNDKSV